MYTSCYVRGIDAWSVYHDRKVDNTTLIIQCAQHSVTYHNIKIVKHGHHQMSKNIVPAASMDVHNHS